MPSPSAPAGARPSFLQSDRRLARAAQPVVRFLQIEAAGGILLVVATVVAMVWANSPWEAAYRSLLETSVRVQVGGYAFEEDVAHVVNDALMAVFFFVVGLEIKREIVVGELRDPRRIAVPAMAALGGMVVPALLYTGFNGGGAGSSGWGVPMATDIAFALGVVALLGTRVPAAAKLVLLTLAIVDDIGAIVVIAIAYTDDLRAEMLAIAVVLVVAAVALRRANVTYLPVYVALAVALWLVVYESGVHATIAGVVMGLLTPAISSDPARDESPCDRLIAALHPWSGFVIVPLFAMMNAGIDVSLDVFSKPSAVLVGVVVGLVVGKLVGVSAFAWLAVRLGLGRLPDGMSWPHLVGIAAVAGIGFTVSLFVSGLAFDDPALQRDARAGILVASLLAAGLGTVILTLVARRDGSVGAVPDSEGWPGPGGVG